MKPDAVFVGFQKTGGGPLALYNIVKEGHPSKGSTVSIRTLRKLRLKIPKNKL